MTAQLKRVRWAVRATLILGVAASVVANVLHAMDNPISQTIAAWPPLALLLTVELISRIPVHSRWLGAARILATAIIAGIAAWVSYWHMQGVATKYGETGASPYLLPLSVDGLIVVASICLVELGQRIQAATGHDGQAASGHDGQAVDGGHDGQAVDGGQPLSEDILAMANDLDEFDRGADAAIAELAKDVASEAEQYLATMARPLPQRRRTVPVAAGVPDQVREWINAWTAAGDGPTGSEVDALIAAYFGRSLRTARRWRQVVTGN